MAEGKCIPNLTATTPIAEAARLTLRARLEVIRDNLNLALTEADRDIETVHDLRVGTRRAVAALDIFSLALPSRVYNQSRKKLRRLRRAAGQARDWDVFLSGLTERDLEPPGSDMLLGYALGQRVAAQDRLQSAGAEFPNGFDPFMTDVLSEIKPSAKGEAVILLDLAAPLLSELVRQFEEAASANLDTYEHLHQTRILGKRLRYAMEIFVDCYEPPFREQLYPAVEEMQEILGRANDSHVARSHLETLRAKLRISHPADGKRCRKVIDDLLRYHRRRLPRDKRQFEKWCKRWQSSRSSEQFTSLLKEPPRSSRVS